MPGVRVTELENKLSLTFNDSVLCISRVAVASFIPGELVRELQVETEM
jgi:hypothetical protein